MQHLGTAAAAVRFRRSIPALCLALAALWPGAVARAQEHEHHHPPAQADTMAMPPVPDAGLAHDSSGRMADMLDTAAMPAWPCPPARSAFP